MFLLAVEEQRPELGPAVEDSHEEAEGEVGLLQVLHRHHHAYQRKHTRAHTGQEKRNINYYLTPATSASC